MVNPSTIPVRNEVMIDFGPTHNTDIFAVGLWYLFKRPLLNQIVLDYLEPELFALCVQPGTFISKSILKHYETEMHRYGENSGFFSCKNFIFLAMTNTVFNDAYNKVHKTLPDHQKKDLEIYKAYAKAVSRDYDILGEIQFSFDVHEQMKESYPQFRGILHENSLFKQIRDHVSELDSLSVDEMNKNDFNRYKRKFLASVAWIAVSIVYAEFLLQTPRRQWYLHGIALTITLVVDFYCMCFVLPEIFEILHVQRKTKEISKRNKFINIGETNSQKEKLIKTLLFYDENDSNV
jgi:hypothetical protein